MSDSDFSPLDPVKMMRIRQFAVAGTYHYSAQRDIEALLQEVERLRRREFGDYSQDDPYYEGPPVEMWWPPYENPERRAEQLLTGQEP